MIRRFGPARHSAGSASELFNPESPSLKVEEIESSLDTTLGRGTRCLWIYTGDSPFRFNSLRQFGELFPKLIAKHPALLNLQWKPRATHLYSFEEDRTELIHSMEEWLTTSFGKRP